jgi:caffeoyl-CoA O-methyltransferase
VLWGGDVLRDPPLDDRTAAIQELNRTVSTDNSVAAVLATIRDGIWVITPHPSTHAVL